MGTGEGLAYTTFLQLDSNWKTNGFSCQVQLLCATWVYVKGVVTQVSVVEFTLLTWQLDLWVLQTTCFFSYSGNGSSGWAEHVLSWLVGLYITLIASIVTILWQAPSRSMWGLDEQLCCECVMCGLGLLRVCPHNPRRGREEEHIFGGRGCPLT